MCNNMGFLENVLSGDFGGHFFILSLYIMLPDQEEIDVLPMVEPQSFAVSSNFLYYAILFHNFYFIGQDNVRGHQFKKIDSYGLRMGCISREFDYILFFDPGHRFNMSL